MSNHTVTVNRGAGVERDKMGGDLEEDELIVTECVLISIEVSSE